MYARLPLRELAHHLKDDEGDDQQGQGWEQENTATTPLRRDDFA